MDGTSPTGDASVGSSPPCVSVGGVTGDNTGEESPVVGSPTIGGVGVIIIVGLIVVPSPSIVVEGDGVGIVTFLPIILTSTNSLACGIDKNFNASFT